MEEFEVTGVAGQPIVLPIGPGPATGHVWRLRLPDGVRQVDDTAATMPDPLHALGASMGRKFQVQAEAGDHQIDAELARPNEEKAVRVVRITLHAQS
ncbi:predicted secreted protein [Jatrophihabitans sp. GAS493]|uniref:protease inhibitor I42 family protein n=1 Tax=Jatrophihabitans sp. GAS493 TaxID=1907575 RepID=UPI000BB7F2EB|nr:protease inhibitor I42 family protein [Jatrophihabitans sp. GAS493]SOD73596.1 predicted secreted protein [Jatrophihabitans sp. GAS493]